MSEHNEFDTFDRNHSHFIDGRLVYCNRLTHCPAICDCPLEEGCTASVQPRTAEQGHETKCLAHAMICAVENARDAMVDSMVSFRVWAQDGGALVWAQEYLDSGTVTCLCPVGPTEGNTDVIFRDVPAGPNEEDVALAQYAAAEAEHEARWDAEHADSTWRLR